MQRTPYSIDQPWPALPATPPEPVSPPELSAYTSHGPTVYTPHAPQRQQQQQPNQSFADFDASLTHGPYDAHGQPLFNPLTLDTMQRSHGRTQHRRALSIQELVADSAPPPTSPPQPAPEPSQGSTLSEAGASSGGVVSTDFATADFAPPTTSESAPEPAPAPEPSPVPVHRHPFATPPPPPVTQGSAGYPTTLDRFSASPYLDTNTTAHAIPTSFSPCFPGSEALSLHQQQQHQQQQHQQGQPAQPAQHQQGPQAQPAQPAQQGQQEQQHEIPSGACPPQIGLWLRGDGFEDAYFDFPDVPVPGIGDGTGRQQQSVRGLWGSVRPAGLW